jgi:hypothetical protein
LGDPPPGNYLWLPDGSVGFFDFGLLRTVDEHHLASERAIARAVRDQDARALKQALVAAGYLPAERADAVDDAFALRLMRAPLRWYAEPGDHRFSPADRRERERTHQRDREPPSEAQRAAAKAQVNQFTVPAESVLIRRMHGVVASVLDALRAGADWGAIAGEYLHGEPPASSLGQAEAAWLQTVTRR